MHDAVLEMVLCGFTEIVAENLKTEIERLEQKELSKSITGFEHEFGVSCTFSYVTEVNSWNIKGTNTCQQLFLQLSEVSLSFLAIQKLASVCHPLIPEECMVALLQKNKTKNRDSNIYPSKIPSSV